jgi:HEPN domain-containing protein
MSVEQQIAAFLRIAAEDLEGAELLWRSKNRNAWYLCEQAAEKLIRAVLTAEGKRGGLGHRLDELVDQLPDENPFKASLRDIEGLTAYATSFRYPTTSGKIPPVRGDLTAFLGKVDRLLKVLSEAFGVDLAGDGPARQPGPGRSGKA